MRRRALVLAAAAMLALGASPQDVAGDVARTIMSPFCDGVTLHDCPSDAADDLRREIVEMAKRGMGKGEIIDALEAEYGPLEATPDNPLARALPWGAGIAALALGAWLARNFSGRRAGPAASVPVPSEAERERVRRELDRFRRDQ